MVEIREKRSVSIPPIRIDKELFVRVGDILKAECPKKHRLSIEIDADSKEIKTEEPKELESIEIPSDIYSITMNIYSEELKLEFFSPVEIEIDLRRPKNSKIRIMGKDATWVLEELLIDWLKSLTRKS